MIKIDTSLAMRLHKLLTDATGGAPGIRDKGLLDSALSAPFQTFDGTDLYPTMEEKAAKLGHSLISNHAFVDGNKRIGVLVMLTFLELNGFTVELDNADVIRIGLGTASGEMDHDGLLEIIRKKTHA